MNELSSPLYAAKSSQSLLICMPLPVFIVPLPFSTLWIIVPLPFSTLWIVKASSTRLLVWSCSLSTINGSQWTACPSVITCFATADCRRPVVRAPDALGAPWRVARPFDKSLQRKPSGNPRIPARTRPRPPSIPAVSPSPLSWASISTSLIATLFWCWHCLIFDESLALGPPRTGCMLLLSRAQLSAWLACVDFAFAVLVVWWNSLGSYLLTGRLWFCALLLLCHRSERRTQFERSVTLLPNEDPPNEDPPPLRLF